MKSNNSLGSFDYGLKFNFITFNILINEFIFLSFFSYSVDLTFLNIIKLLELVNSKKTSKLFSQKNNYLHDENTVFVKEGLVKKEIIDQDFNFFNISEFVLKGKKQKEIYLSIDHRITFFLKNNLIIQKKFIFDKNYQRRLDKIFYNYFLKIRNIGNFFFIQYRIYGLGFRLKKSSIQNSRSLRFEIGYGHGIYYILPLDIKCLKRKRRFFIFGSSFDRLEYVKTHINNFKMLNPYKIRGLKDIKYEIKMKKGKKQAKK